MVREEVELESLRQLVVEHTDPEMGDFVMTAGQRLIEQGWQKGHQEGANQEKHQIAANMLKENADPAFISRTTGLPLDEVQKLKTDTH